MSEADATVFCVSARSSALRGSNMIFHCHSVEKPTQYLKLQVCQSCLHGILVMIGSFDTNKHGCVQELLYKAVTLTLGTYPYFVTVIFFQDISCTRSDGSNTYMYNVGFQKNQNTVTSFSIWQKKNKCGIAQNLKEWEMNSKPNSLHRANTPLTATGAGEKLPYDNPVSWSVLGPWLQSCSKSCK